VLHFREKKETIKLSLGIAYLTYLLGSWALAYKSTHNMMFFKEIYSEKENSNDSSPSLA
jgi:hypothetical protein